MKLNRFIGDRAFYRRALSIAIPVLIQNTITSFVSLLDNIMVGQVGTLQMSGVSIVNSLLLVFNLCIFGANAGGGIFVAQFHGSGDHTSVRRSHRVKLYTGCAITLLSILLFLLAGDGLIGLYLQGEGDARDAALALDFGREYLAVMLFGLLPFALTTSYSGTLRETGHTAIPMAGGVLAVLVNLALNYILIFGHFGAPALGVKGAAIATVISRYVELIFVAGWAHLNPGKNPFIKGLFRSFYVPKALLGNIFRKGMPLILNEFLWSTGLAVIHQSYSTCGLDVVPALNIANTIFNLANVSSIAFGNAVAIMMGQLMGSGAKEAEVRDTNRKLLALTVFCGAVVGVALLFFSDLFPTLYNTSDSVRHLAGQMIRIIAIMLPVSCFTLATYFTLRSGGQALITFLFDSCYQWVCPVLLSFLLTRLTDIPILPLYTLCQAVDVIRCFIGAHMLKQGKWINNLTV